MIKVRCREVNIQFRLTANRSGQRICTSDCGECTALIFERLGDMVIIHFVRQGKQGENIVLKNLFWPMEVVAEWMCEGIDSITYAGTPAPKPGEERYP